MGVSPAAASGPPLAAVAPPSGAPRGASPPTVDQVRAALRADLADAARALRALGVAKLLGRRSFTARDLDAMLAGTFSARLTGTGRGPRVARDVVVARGSVVASTAGRYALKLRLTEAGRRLLRRDRRPTMTLTLEFRDTSGRTVTTGRPVGLRR